jgi:hypothetical protein
MFTLRENMLFCEQRTRSFELESVLLLRMIVKFLTMFGDQRERVETSRAAACIGRPACRPAALGK